MTRTLVTGLCAGILAISFAAAPAMAQGQGGVKTDSTAENPSTKTGSAAERARDTKGTNTGGTPAAGNEGASQAGSGTGAKGQGMGTPSTGSDPRANPEKPVSGR